MFNKFTIKKSKKKKILNFLCQFVYHFLGNQTEKRKKFKYYINTVLELFKNGLKLQIPPLDKNK